MSLLLGLKALGNKEVINQVKSVEKYQERHGCIIISEVHDDGVYVYDSRRGVFLLNILV